MLTLLLLACGPKTPAPAAATEPGAGLSAAPSDPDADWFPLVDGALWTYQATFEGREYHETRAAVEVSIAGESAWVFLPLDEADNPIVFSSMFGLGAYRRTGAGVETAPAFWLADIEGLSGEDFQPLLRLPPEVGQRVTWGANGDRAWGLEVLGYEALELPAGRFEDCLKIQLGEDSYAWLAPGVGLVKWALVTGRVEELEDFRLP